MADLLDIAGISDVLLDVRYRPGWTFLTYLGRHEGPHLRIRAELPNSYQPHETTVIDVNRYIPRVARRDADHLLDWLLEQLERIENHECREHFRHLGRVWDDPHGVNADRDL